MLARAVAGEACLPFFTTRLDENDEWSMRMGTRRVRNLFKAAKQRSPCVVFLDGIDDVGRGPKSTDSSVTWSTLNHLLLELDSLNQDDRIIVFGATSSLRSLDRSLLEQGRFDDPIYVPFPGYEGRKEVLGSLLLKVVAADEVNTTTLVEGTDLSMGADLAEIVNIADVRAALDGAKDARMAHLEYAIDRFIRGDEAWNKYLRQERESELRIVFVGSYPWGDGEEYLELSTLQYVMHGFDSQKVQLCKK